MNRNFSRAWIDYQETFDSVPNSWVEKSIENEVVKKNKILNY